MKTVQPILVIKLITLLFFPHLVDVLTAHSSIAFEQNFFLNGQFHNYFGVPGYFSRRFNVIGKHRYRQISKNSFHWSFVFDFIEKLLKFKCCQNPKYLCGIWNLSFTFYHKAINKNSISVENPNRCINN